MSKPEDIPQDVWKQALTLVDAVVDSALYEDAPDCNEVIARAILGERERCAEAARRHLEVGQQVAARSSLVGYAAEFYGAAKIEVPDAIRKGSK